jgi:hypothetical protein
VKIFGIGLQKTGTTTLGDCLKQFGFRHSSYNRRAAWYLRKGCDHKLKEIMDLYDSFEDEPWAHTYKLADSLYPDAKFILTVRNSAEKWYQSICNHCDRIPFNEHREFFFDSILPRENRSEYIKAYEEHILEAQEYFKGREDKLLILDWTQDNALASLGHFLNVDCSKMDVPKSNAAPVKVFPRLTRFGVYQYYPKYYWNAVVRRNIHTITKKIVAKLT